MALKKECYTPSPLRKKHHCCNCTTANKNDSDVYLLGRRVFAQYWNNLRSRPQRTTVCLEAQNVASMPSDRSITSAARERQFPVSEVALR